MKLTRSGLVALVFLGGCAVGGASSQLVEPAQAHGDTPEPPAATGPQQKWDYHCLVPKGGWGPERMINEMKAAGGKGWELAGVGGSFWCFKRPM
jgi:hypothetical protein